MANSVTGVRNIQERSTGANKHNDEGTAKGHKSQPKEFPVANVGTMWRTKEDSTEL